MLRRSEQLLFWNLKPISESYGCRWVLVELKEQQSLTKQRLVVLPGAAIAMSACAYLVVEGTIYFVILCSIFLCEPFCHFTPIY